jgi:hypothetical protein
MATRTSVPAFRGEPAIGVPPHTFDPKILIVETLGLDLIWTQSLLNQKDTVPPLGRYKTSPIFNSSELS